MLVGLAEKYWLSVKHNIDKTRHAHGHSKKKKRLDVH
jgi:hypothetical protein